jgi:hypothetical protein
LNLKNDSDILIKNSKCGDKFKGCFRKKGGNKKTSKLMVTPCNHIFHPECLKVWSERKSECPICRKSIPAIDD